MIVGCNRIQQSWSRRLAPWGIRPSQPIYKVEGLIDLTFNHHALSGTLGTSMPIIFFSLYKEGQGELEDWLRDQTLAIFKLDLCGIEVCIPPCSWAHSNFICEHKYIVYIMEGRSWMMRDNEPKGSTKVCKQSNTRQTHLNVGSTYSMELEPKLTPCSEGNAPIHPIIDAHSCR